jgi:hypothetical protein
LNLICVLTETGNKPNPNILRRYPDSDSVGREIYAPWLATGAQEWIFGEAEKALNDINSYVVFTPYIFV